MLFYLRKMVPQSLKHKFKFLKTTITTSKNSQATKRHKSCYPELARSDHGDIKIEGIFSFSEDCIIQLRIKKVNAAKSLIQKYRLISISLVH